MDGVMSILPLSQLIDCSVRMRSCSIPVALEISYIVPRKLLVTAVYRIPPEKKEREERGEE